ncbi:MAG: hypothetical protein IJT75_01665 [Bacteroidaceae bacterium]|nr:hypothetical protein [Bacteroidaceae bacterium]
MIAVVIGFALQSNTFPVKPPTILHTFFKISFILLLSRPRTNPLFMIKKHISEPIRQKKERNMPQVSIIIANLRPISGTNIGKHGKRPGKTEVVSCLSVNYSDKSLGQKTFKLTNL